MIKAIKSIFSKYASVIAYTAVAMCLIAFIAFMFSWQSSDTLSGDKSYKESADLNKFNAKEVNCLALNIYFEARGSNLADKIAVADVVMNRTHDRRYPDTVCKVISQGVKKDRKDCQFSWKCDGKSKTPRDLDSWDEAKTIAYNMYVHDKYRGITEGATHYHATYVKPYWAKSLQLVGRIGEHIYYRWE
jgi:spore germination cell wall hydrolase CwlJ-like protein